jgi:thioredoxin-like negative regulator of GroEL
MMSGVNAAGSLHVACLCAAWCRLCDGYRAVLEQVEADLRAAGAAARWHWIDIEDQADLVGDLDVETFPTIVVCDARHVRFVGPVTPQPETLSRLLRSLLLDQARGAAWPAAAPEAEGFAQRLRLA